MAKITLRAFGEEALLETLDNTFLNGDMTWRLADVYGPYFASRTFEGQGAVVDIGAGIGSFSILFAKAFPQTHVYCFEPDAEQFELLGRNIASNGLGNITAFNFAITAEALSAERVKALSGIGADFDDAQLRALSVRHPFLAYDAVRSYIERFRDGMELVEGARMVEFDCLHASVLLALKPSVVKMTAPLWESDILHILKAAPIDHTIAESWMEVDSRHLFASPHRERQFLVRRAGSHLALRRDLPTTGTVRDGLDIVIPMYNGLKCIEECVASLTRNDREDIHVIVVDDGSTDGCGEFVAEKFVADSRVRVVRKPNGGCASARNYGRRFSMATHIAFVDADDVADQDLFPKLFELARHTSAETVQAGFDFMDETDEGVSFRESYEDAQFVEHKKHPFLEGHQYFSAQGASLIAGQPTIWRRIYRRDFLDNKRVYFPEHIRAFDDLFFHILTLHHSGSIPILEGPKYHYRQHPLQDIKQADERHFYSLEMYRLIIKRGLQEGWSDFAPILRSYVNTVNWSLLLLSRDLNVMFLKGAAQLWVYMEKALGTEAAFEQLEKDFRHMDFRFFVEGMRRDLKALHGTYAFTYLDSVWMQPNFVRMARQLL